MLKRGVDQKTGRGYYRNGVRGKKYSYTIGNEASRQRAKKRALGDDPVRCSNAVIRKTMGEFKRHKLMIGRSHKPVRSQRQAIAISLSKARSLCARAPAKRRGPGRPRSVGRPKSTKRPVGRPRSVGRPRGKSTKIPKIPAGSIVYIVKK